jgi:predicted transcriptional regulator
MIKERSTIVMSIAPKWVEMIKSGQKKFELRRRAPKEIGRCDLLIYATKPISAVVAVGKIVSVLRGRPNTLWCDIGQFSGCTEEEFFKYFDGVVNGAAMQLSEIRSIPPISVTTLRTKLRWHPPVSWMRASADLIKLVEVQ